MRRFAARFDQADDGEVELRSQSYQRLRLELSRPSGNPSSTCGGGRSATR
jgi:hypothetical protein